MTNKTNNKNVKQDRINSLLFKTGKAMGIILQLIFWWLIFISIMLSSIGGIELTDFRYISF